MITSEHINMAPRQQPSIGRIVHYQGGEETQAAIVTAVHSETCVSLACFTTIGIFFVEKVEHASVHGVEVAVDCWNWPPFVPPTK